MKIKDLYYEIYDKCDEILGSFIMQMIVNYRKDFGDEEIIEAYKKRFGEYSCNNIGKKYQKWYTNSLIILNAIMPERKKEFIDLYSPDPKRKTLTVLNYTISDAIIGYSYNQINPTISITKIQQQINIIKSLKDIIDSKINDIKLLIENEVFENELESARYLLLKGFNRASGAICGVLLERHLKSMLVTPMKKSSPTLNELNTELYKNNIIDGTQNKYLLYLSDIRNKCDHDKDSEPTKEEIEELISGTEKVIMTYN